MRWQTIQRLKTIGRVALAIGIVLVFALINLNIFLAFKPL